MEQVYEAIAKASQAYTLPAPWQNVPCDPAFMRLPTDSAALLAELRKQFPDERLVQAGVVAVDATGSVALIPQIAAGVDPLWAIRCQSDQEVTAFIAQLHTVGKRDWPLATALRDPKQSEAIVAADGQIIVAYSMPDLAILRSLGMAAVPGSHWRRLSKPQLDFLCQTLGIAPHAPAPLAASVETITQGAGSLVLANWSMATMDRTDVDAATTSWSHLVELHRYLELSFDDFGLWKPSQQTLKRLEFQLQYQDVRQVHAGLLEGIGQDATAIDVDLGPKRPVPKSIVEAYRAWRQADRDAVNPVARRKAYDQLCELLDRQRFDPLVEEALRATNPLERNAEIALAETSRLLQPQILLLTEKIRHSIGENGTRAGNTITQEELDQVLALSDRLMALTQGVQACRRNQPAKMVKSLKPTAVRCAPSASSQKKSPR
jgi:hypothetical protein